MAAGIFNCVIPFVKNVINQSTRVHHSHIFSFFEQIILLYVISVIQGLAFGALDVIGNVCILLLHGDKVAPWIQAMHFFFALGSAVNRKRNFFLPT